MFPVVHFNRIKNFVKTVNCHRVSLDGLSTNNLLDEEALSKISGIIAERLWSGFLQFGTPIVGFIGIWLIIKSLKFVIDILIHGYVLYLV